jgi:hypothetical protein
MAEKNFEIKVTGVESVGKRLKRLGLTAKQSRTQINKALRPAANKLARGMKQAYKSQFKSKNPGLRYDTQAKAWNQGTRTADTIGVKVAKRSKNPGLFVGPIAKKVNPHYWRKGPSRNLAAMQIEGYVQGSEIKIFPNVFKITAERMGNDVSSTAEKSIGRLVDKLIRKAGF